MTSEDQFSDSRQHDRWAIDADCELKLNNGHVYMGKSVNISFGGILLIAEGLEYHQDENISGNLEIRAKVHDRELRVKATCQVIHTSATGMGICFETIENDSVEILHELILELRNRKTQENISNRRKFIRFGICVPAELTVENGDRYFGETRNVSLGGVYIMSKELDVKYRVMPSLGDVGQIKLLCEIDHELHTISSSCKVVHVDSLGAGIQYFNFDEENKIKLKHLFQKYLEKMPD